MLDHILNIWCKFFHRAGYPINSQYICPNCHRTHTVAW